MSPVRTHRPPASRARPQRGIMLIEALIAILIFTVGILGVMGLQATAVRQSTDARYRAEASHLADELLGQMWSGNRALTNLQTLYNTCGTTTCSGYKTWLGRVQATLPGVVAGTNTEPSVDVDDEGVVTITVYWRPPTDETGTERHRYDVQTQIGQ